jgi:hypothetical protein
MFWFSIRTNVALFCLHLTNLPQHLSVANCRAEIREGPSDVHSYIAPHMAIVKLCADANKKPAKIGLVHSPELSASSLCLEVRWPLRSINSSVPVMYWVRNLKSPYISTNTAVVTTPWPHHRRPSIIKGCCFISADFQGRFWSRCARRRNHIYQPQSASPSTWQHVSPLGHIHVLHDFHCHSKFAHHPLIVSKLMRHNLPH